MCSALNVLAYAAISAFAVLAGGGIASIRAPRSAVRSAFQHLAAGVAFAALATKLLPDVMHRRCSLLWQKPYGYFPGMASAVVLAPLLSGASRLLRGKN